MLTLKSCAYLRSITIWTRTHSVDHTENSSTSCPPSKAFQPSRHLWHVCSHNSRCRHPRLSHVQSEAQRGYATCLRSHCKGTGETGIQPGDHLPGVCADTTLSLESTQGEARQFAVSLLFNSCIVTSSPVCRQLSPLAFLCLLSVSWFSGNFN